MQTFKQHLNEATGGYIHFPKSDDEVDALDFIPDEKKDALKDLLKTIQTNKSGVKDPIALDASNPNNVKVMRTLALDFDLKALSTNYGFKVSAGNGSRGGGGSKSKGFAFEDQIIQDVEKYIAQGPDADFQFPDMMSAMHNSFLKDAQSISVRSDGAANTKRPLQVTDASLLIGGRDLNVGPRVTDVTVTADGVPYYLSAKFGGTVTFFNVGVTKVFPASEFEAGKFKSREALSILKAFGIDEKEFINIFTSYDPRAAKRGGKKTRIDVTKKINKRMLQQMLLTGVGYGYWMVHQKGKKVEFYEMTKRKMMQSAKIQKVTILYPEPGSAKRLDIEVLTPRYEFKINIRNKQGGLYPSHIMADYKYRSND
jgi:hypothetical protein